MTATNEAIFWPMIAQAILTAIVTWRMYARRVAEIRARRIHPQRLATRQQASGELDDVAAADNYQNLFEAPVLFFVVCLAFAVTDTVGYLQLVLAWAYVALRAVHSYIHLTRNKVMRRFLIFLSSSVVLLLMWLLFAVTLALRAV